MFVIAVSGILGRKKKKEKYNKKPHVAIFSSIVVFPTLQQGRILFGVPLAVQVCMVGYYFHF